MDSMLLNALEIGNVPFFVCPRLGSYKGASCNGSYKGSPFYLTVEACCEDGTVIFLECAVQDWGPMYIRGS